VRLSVAASKTWPAAGWRSKRGSISIGMVDDHGGIAEFFVDPSQT
jgi:hypothetical protein